MHRFADRVVIALGGSVIHPNRIDVVLIKRFRSLLAPFIKKRIRFVLVVGGGRLSRLLQEAVSKMRRISDKEKDWIGIQATKVNAHLVHIAFGKLADPRIVEREDMLRSLRYPVTIASGWKPGWSTDYVAVRIADLLRVHEVVVAGKPAYVYDRDPKHKKAKPLPELSWRAYTALVPRKWHPGLHAPVDPVAARLAKQKKITAVVVYGKDLANFARLLKGKKFKGTIVR